MWPSTIPRVERQHINGKRVFVPIPRYVMAERKPEEERDRERIERLFHNSPVQQKHHNASRAARNYAESDRTDPFAYNRAYSRMMNGSAIPDDYRKNGRA